MPRLKASLLKDCLESDGKEIKPVVLEVKIEETDDGFIYEGPAEKIETKYALETRTIWCRTYTTPISSNHTETDSHGPLEVDPEDHKAIMRKVYPLFRQVVATHLSEVLKHDAKGTNIPKFHALFGTFDYYYGYVPGI